MAIMNVWPSMPSRSSASRNAWTQSSTATMCRRMGRPSGWRRATAASRPAAYVARCCVVHQLLPDRDAEAVAGHGQVVEDVVLGMDPRDPQADGRHAGLVEVLLEHRLFQHFRQRVVARDRRPAACLRGSAPAAD